MPEHDGGRQGTGRGIGARDWHDDATRRIARLASAAPTAPVGPGVLAAGERAGGTLGVALLRRGDRASERSRPLFTLTTPDQRPALRRPLTPKRSATRPRLTIQSARPAQSAQSAPSPRSAEGVQAPAPERGPAALDPLTPAPSEAARAPAEPQLAARASERGAGGLRYVLRAVRRLAGRRDRQQRAAGSLTRAPRPEARPPRYADGPAPAPPPLEGPPSADRSARIELAQADAATRDDTGGPAVDAATEAAAGRRLDLAAAAGDRPLDVPPSLDAGAPATGLERTEAPPPAAPRRTPPALEDPPEAPAAAARPTEARAHPAPPRSRAASDSRLDLVTRVARLLRRPAPPPPAAAPAPRAVAEGPASRRPEVAPVSSPPDDAAPASARAQSPAAEPRSLIAGAPHSQAVARAVPEPSGPSPEAAASSRPPAELAAAEGAPPPPDEGPPLRGSAAAPLDLVARLVRGRVAPAEPRQPHEPRPTRGAPRPAAGRVDRTETTPEPQPPPAASAGSAPEAPLLPEASAEAAPEAAAPPRQRLKRLCCPIRRGSARSAAAARGIRRGSA